MLKFIKKRAIRPSQLVLVGDQLLMALGLISALFFFYRVISIKPLPDHTIFNALSVHIGLGVSSWIIFGVYRKVIRFFNSKDYLNLLVILFLIHTASSTIAQISWFFPIPKNRLMPEVYLISFFITTFYIIGSRFLISYLYFYYKRNERVKNQKKLLIYGAGELGVFLKNSIHTHYKGEYKLIAFLDDDKQKIGRYIGGVKVISASVDVEDYISKHQISDVIFANKTISPARKAAFLETVLHTNVRIREISSIQSFFSTKFNLDKLANIDIHDLMNREPIELYDEHVASNLHSKTVLVTGAAGSIGSEIVRKLSEHNASLIICVDFSESALYDLEQELKVKYPDNQYHYILNDIRNNTLLEAIFIEYKPDYVYHAAAYKHVPLMEQFPWEAVETNVFATHSLVKLSIAHQVQKFVFISSDKAVNPTSVMGATKRLAEIIVRAYSAENPATCFVITRFGNVLGSNGSVVPLFKKQIQSGGPVTVTHPDMIRYFMTIAEACQLVLEASVMAEGGEVFVFDMGEPVKIVDLARNMIRLAGYTPDVDIKIKFIGERPGEKLFEEIFTAHELMKDTHNEKIMISKESVHQLPEANLIIEKLESLKGVFQPELYRIVIKELLPEFKTVSGNANIVNFNSGNKIPTYQFQN